MVAVRTVRGSGGWSLLFFPHTLPGVDILLWREGFVVDGATVPIPGAAAARQDMLHGAGAEYFANVVAHAELPHHSQEEEAEKE